MTSYITERKNSNNSIKIKVELVEWSLGKNYRNNGAIIKDIKCIILATTEDYELIEKIKGNNTLRGGQKFQHSLQDMLTEILCDNLTIPCIERFRANAWRKQDLNSKPLTRLYISLKLSAMELET